MIVDCRRYAPLLIGLALLVVPVFARAEQKGDQSLVDPVVAQVIEMLDAGVDEEIIGQWLVSTDRRPQDMSAGGLVALTQAGASKDLIGRLLDLVADTGRSSEPLGNSHAPARVPPPVDQEPLAPRILDEAGKEAYPAAGVDIPADVLFLLSYKKIYTQEPEPDYPPPEPWTVFAYLDGELVAWVTDSLEGEPVRANRLLAPGRHVVRVTQERHFRQGKKWVHESRVAPTFIAFDVVPGKEMEVDLRFHGHWVYRGSRGPLTYAIRQGNRTLDEEGPTGGDPSEWQLVCEDVEANFPEDGKVPRLYRWEMARCTPWSDLWDGTGEQTSRTELLAEMRKSDFQPTFR